MALGRVDVGCHLVYLQCDGVVFDVATFLIQHFVPGHEVAEAPVILLAVEQVGDLCGRKGRKVSGQQASPVLAHSSPGTVC